MDHQNLSPKSFPAILKPSVKWRTLNLIKQAVEAKRGRCDLDKVGTRWPHERVRTLLCRLKQQTGGRT